MRFLVGSILLFSFINPLYASTEYLKCFGAEEAFIHKNEIKGAYKKLNQELISELVMFDESVALKQDIYDQVCRPQIQFPSLELIKFSILLKSSPFLTTVDKNDLKQYSVDTFTIKNFKSQSHYIFIQFLNNLQSEVEDPHCMAKEFPQLKEFFTRTRFILKETGIVKLMAEIDKKEEIFKKLQDFSWKKACVKK